MASFLNTQQIIQSISTIISNSKKELVLISPYIQINSTYAEHLTRIDSNGRKITLVFGKSILNTYEVNFLKTLKNLDLRYFEHLHAKCYYNESHMVISSMNMYQASERNKEMGVWIHEDAEADKGLYQAAHNEAEFIICNARPVSLNSIDEFSLYIPPQYQTKSLSLVLNNIWVQFINIYRGFEVIPTILGGIEMVIVKNWFFGGVELRIEQGIKLLFYNTDDQFLNSLKQGMDSDLKGKLYGHQICWNKVWNGTELCIKYQNINTDDERISWIQSTVSFLQSLLSKNKSILYTIPAIN